MKRRTIRKLAVVLLTATVLGCATYSDRVAPVQLPEKAANRVRAAGAIITARAYLYPEEAKDAFGFDIRKTGILPVEVVIDNRSASNITINTTQTFLIDNAGNLWPSLSTETACNRVKKHIEMGETLKGTAKPALGGAAAGAVIGGTIGVLTGKNVGESAGKGAVAGAAAGAVIGGASGYASSEEKAREWIYEKSLENRKVLPNEIAHGFLFFPGKDEEAASAKELRLSLSKGTLRKVVTIHLEHY
jgi:hypothetical protein